MKKKLISPEQAHPRDVQPWADLAAGLIERGSHALAFPTQPNPRPLRALHRFINPAQCYKCDEMLHPHPPPRPSSLPPKTKPPRRLQATQNPRLRLKNAVFPPKSVRVFDETKPPMRGPGLACPSESVPPSSPQTNPAQEPSSPHSPPRSWPASPVPGR
jgi:hypothetical protein